MESSIKGGLGKGVVGRIGNVDYSKFGEGDWVEVADRKRDQVKIVEYWRSETEVEWESVEGQNQTEIERVESNGQEEKIDQQNGEITNSITKERWIGWRVKKEDCGELR